MSSFRPPLMLFALVLLFTGTAKAQIAPACADIPKPSNYSEDDQQAFLANYFASSFLLYPSTALMPAGDGKAGIALETGLVPPLPCERRFVLDHTKTEETNQLPVMPRPRLWATTPALSLPEGFGKIGFLLGGSLVPPVPMPMGTLSSVAVEFGAAYRSPFGLDAGLRAYMGWARARAEIATPFVEDAPAVDDLFFAQTMGIDLAAAWGFDVNDFVTLRPYASAGIADVTTLFLIGDDELVMDNPKPWWGFVGSAGLQAVLWRHWELAVEMDVVVPVVMTGRARIGFLF